MGWDSNTRCRYAAVCLNNISESTRFAPGLCKHNRSKWSDSQSAVQLRFEEKPVSYSVKARWTFKIAVLLHCFMLDEIMEQYPWTIVTWDQKGCIFPSFKLEFRVAAALIHLTPQLAWKHVSRCRTYKNNSVADRELRTYGEVFGRLFRVILGVQCICTPCCSFSGTKSFAKELTNAHSCKMLITVDFKASGHKLGNILRLSAKRKGAPLPSASQTSLTYNRKREGPIGTADNIVDHESRFRYEAIHGVPPRNTVTFAGWNIAGCGCMSFWC